MGTVHDKVIRPNMVSMPGAKPHTGAIVQPQTSPFGLFCGYFEPLTAPDPFNPLVVHVPTFGTQQGSDPPIAVTPILAGQADNRLGQRFFIVTLNKYAPLCRSRLPQYMTSPALSPSTDRSPSRATGSVTTRSRWNPHRAGHPGADSDYLGLRTGIEMGHAQRQVDTQLTDLTRPSGRSSGLSTLCQTAES